MGKILSVIQIQESRFRFVLMVMLITVRILDAIRRVQLTNLDSAKDEGDIRKSEIFLDGLSVPPLYPLCPTMLLYHISTIFRFSLVTQRAVSAETCLNGYTGVTELLAKPQGSKCSANKKQMTVLLDLVNFSNIC